jgi:hypothetical protein
MTRFYEEAQQARLRRQSQKASWTAGPAEAPALSNDESYSKI